jgi:hypothetical protein
MQLPDSNQNKKRTRRMPVKKVVEQLDIAKVVQENREVFQAFMNAGMIDPVWIMRLEIWLEFKGMKEDEPTMKKYYKIAIRKNVSVKTVQRAINQFK